MRAQGRPSVRVVLTDWEWSDLSVEREVLEPLGVELVAAQARTPSEIVAAARGASALLVQYGQVDAQVLGSLDTVGLVSRYGVGVDSVDLQAARAHGVWVCNVVDYGAEEVTMHTASLMLAAVRHVPFLDREIREGRWHYRAGGAIPAMSDLTLGIAGVGRIGRRLHGLLGGSFGAVLGHDPLVETSTFPTGMQPCGLEELFARADVITLHLPLDDATRRMVDGDMLAQTGPGAVLVNTARGGLIDPAAVIDALGDGRLRAAALDVHPQEPPAPDDPLTTHPRVVMTPHVAWYSERSELDLRRKAAMNIAGWLRGERPRTVVVEGQREPVWEPA